MTTASKTKNYKLTYAACCCGISIQALVGNITAVFFIPLRTLYGLTFSQLGLLVTIFYAVQVVADLIITVILPKTGFKKMCLGAIGLVMAGILLFAFVPILFPGAVYGGIVAATAIFAFACGMLEVMLTPIVSYLPKTGKSVPISVMHSFYAWGQVATIILTTVFLWLAGIENWNYVLFIWLLLPVITFFVFLFSPVVEANEHHEKQPKGEFKKTFLSPFYIVALLAIMFGAASEIVMNQWSSGFFEKVLQLDKLTGDLVGMTFFATMMGVGRLVYGLIPKKPNISLILITSSALAILCYFAVAFSQIAWLTAIACAVCGLAVSLLWPGTLMLSSNRFASAGPWIFGLLSLTGDIGAAGGPFVTGAIADLFTIEAEGLRVSMLVCAVFPALALLCHVILAVLNKKKKGLLKGGLEGGKTDIKPEQSFH